MKPFDLMKASNIEAVIFQESDEKTVNNHDLKGRKIVHNGKATLQVVGDQPTGALSQYQSRLSQAKAQKKSEHRPRRNASGAMKDLLCRDGAFKA